MVIRVTHAPSPFAWWSSAVGQFSEVLKVYEPTGYLCVRLMLPIPEYDSLIEKLIEQHRQVEGWIDPRFVEVI